MVLTPLAYCGVSPAEDALRGGLRQRGNSMSCVALQRLDASPMRLRCLAVISNDGRGTPSTRRSIHNLLRSKH